MSKVFKSVKKILPAAIPIAASFIPGIGPLGMAAAGALGGVAGGGGLKGALMGGALSGLGAGMFGAAPAQGSSLFSQANNSLFNSMAPLRSLGTGISDFLSPVKSIFGASSASKPSLVTDEILKQSFPNVAVQNAARAAAGLEPVADSSGGFLSGLLGKDNLKDLAFGASIFSELNPNKNGMLSQRDIVARMDAEKAKQEEDNAKFISSLNAPPPQRNQTKPNIDYYSYGYRPEEKFFDNIEAGRTAFKKGGKVKSDSPLTSMGGQDDKINAKLSAGEYVIPADVVSGLGDGNTEAGAKKLDELLKNLRKQKAPALKKGVLPPKAKSPLTYMGAVA